MSNKKYYSFGSVPKLHDNGNGVVSPLGELSSDTRNYAKDPGVYAKDTDTVLINFYSKQDNAFVAFPREFAEKEIDICDWLVKEAEANRIRNDPKACLQAIKAQFSGDIEVTAVGEMVTNSVIWLPSYFEGVHITPQREGRQEERAEFRVWLANEYFATGYPFRDIAIVHPVELEQIDLLIDLNYLQLGERLLEETPDVIEQRVKVFTENAKYPYCNRRVLPFKIFDRINKGKFVIGYWTALIWGNSADSDDEIYEKIQEEIKSNTKHPLNYWEEAIPDLFNPLEFYVTPYWDRLGMRNKTNNSSNYSPIADYQTMLVNPKKYSKVLLNSITDDHLIKSLQTIPHQYKSIMLGFVAKPSNYGELTKISQLYGDYSIVSSDDPDFGRMQETTITFIEKLQGLIAAAENMTPDSIPPKDIFRKMVGDKVFAVRKIGNVKYTMVTRYQFIKDGVIE